jgi:hypothetical protein
MTQDEIIEMAKEAGLSVGVALDGSKSMGKHENKSFAVGRLPLEDFLSFVQLVAAKEREACARFSQTLPNPDKHCQISSHAYDMAIVDYSRAVRARGEAL